MKREIAFGKLRNLCERFDQATPETNDFLPLRAWLFGSLLTEKPEPADIDMLVQFDESRLMAKLRQKEYFDIQADLREIHRAVQVYCAGMRMIHIEMISPDRTVESWFASRKMPLDTPHTLIWEAGKDWQATLEEIRLHPPLSHDPQGENLRKLENIRGERRIQPIIQLIRRKLHVGKHDWADAVFDPVGMRRGFVVCATSDDCPPEFADILTTQGYRCTLANGAKRKFLEIGLVHWVWNAEGDDIVGLGVVIFEPFGSYRSEAEAWMRKKIDDVFDKAKVERLPVVEVA